VIFINQYTHDFFLDVVKRLSSRPGQHFLITGSKVDKISHVNIIRCCSLRRSNAIKRILSWVLFTSQALFHLIKRASGQHLLIVTNPPMNIWLGPLLKCLKNNRYSCLIYDVYPEALKVGNMVILYFFSSFIWKKLNAFALLHADNIITLSEDMAHTLQAHVGPDKNIKINIIDNWSDEQFIRPIPKKENPIIKELKIQDKLTVSYSGTFGMTHGVKTIIECAIILRDNKNVFFLMSGGGFEKEKIKKDIIDAKLSNIIILPYQPIDRFKFVAAAADISIILQKEGAEKTSMPSKTYTAMAAGAAIIAATNKKSYLAHLIEENKCGLVVPPGDAPAMAKAILYFYENTELLNQCKLNSRQALVSKYSREAQCKKYEQILIENQYLAQ